MKARLIHAITWTEEREIHECPHCGAAVDETYLTIDRAFGKVETVNGETLAEIPEFSEGDFETVEARCYECGETMVEATEALAKTPAEIARVREFAAVLEDARRAEREE